MSARHLAGCDTRGGNWICATGCPVAAQRTEKETIMAEPTAERDAPTPLPDADVWPVHRALGDWMWKDADAPRLARDAQWRIAEWIVRRERESERASVAALIETGRHNGASARAALARAVERLADYDTRVTPPDEDVPWCGGSHLGACHVPDSTGVCELSTRVTPPAESEAG